MRREYWAEIWGEVEPRSEFSPARVALKSRAAAQAESLPMVILLDVKHFYDHISLELLAARGLDLSYPPLLLQMAISAHEAARWILAEDLSAEPVLPAQGILAGCPQAVSFARLISSTDCFFSD